MAIKQFLIRTFMFLICAITAHTSFSQNKTITGKISDEKGSPIGAITREDYTFSSSVFRDFS